MAKLTSVAVVSSFLAFLGTPSYGQTRLPSPPPPSLPNPTGYVSSPNSSVVRMLQPGDFGDDVASLQLALNRNGIDPGPIDGDYGPMTRAAVSEFQQIYGLSVTGVADTETLDALGVDIDDGGSEVAVVAANSDMRDRHYIAAVTESPRKLGQVQQIFRGATVDSVRQGEFINIGQYSSRSSAAERVREAHRFGFDARILYQR